LGGSRDRAVFITGAAVYNAELKKTPINAQISKAFQISVINAATARAKRGQRDTRLPPQCSCWVSASALDAACGCSASDCGASAGAAAYRGAFGVMSSGL